MANGKRLTSNRSLTFAVNVDLKVSIVGKLEHTLQNRIKGAHSRYLELFWPHTKLPLNGRKPENNGLIR